MKAFVLVLLLWAVTAPLDAQDSPFKAPKAKAATSAPTAWGRATSLLRAAYGVPVADDFAEQVVTSFVAAAARQDKKAPTTGTREEKAAYYLKTMRAVHDETYLREQAQKAADARVEELRATLPE